MSLPATRTICLAPEAVQCARWIGIAIQLPRSEKLSIYLHLQPLHLCKYSVSSMTLAHQISFPALVFASRFHHPQFSPARPFESALTSTAASRSGAASVPPGLGHFRAKYVRPGRAACALIVQTAPDLTPRLPAISPAIDTFPGADGRDGTGLSRADADDGRLLSDRAVNGSPR